MKLMKKIAVLAATLVSAPLVLAADPVCRDDPRLYTIGNVIQQLDAGQAINPLKLTAETFLALTPGVRTKLGDNILVYDANCTPYQVYQNKPPVAVKIPFESQLHYFTQSLARGDTQAVRFSIDYFEPIEKPIHDLIQMVAPIDMAPPAMQQLKEMQLLPVAGMGHESDTSHTVRFCSQFAARNSLLDLYVLFGGKVRQDQKSVVFANWGSKSKIAAGKNHMILSNPIQMKKNNKYDACNPYNMRQVAAQLQRTGTSIFDFDKSQHPSDVLLEQIDKHNGYVN